MQPLEVDVRSRSSVHGEVTRSAQPRVAVLTVRQTRLSRSRWTWSRSRPRAGPPRKSVAESRGATPPPWGAPSSGPLLRVQMRTWEVTADRSPQPRPGSVLPSSERSRVAPGRAGASRQHGGGAAPALSNRPTSWAHALGIADAAGWFPSRTAAKISPMTPVTPSP